MDQKLSCKNVPFHDIRGHYLKKKKKISPLTQFQLDLNLKKPPSWFCIRAETWRHPSNTVMDHESRPPSKLSPPVGTGRQICSGMTAPRAFKQHFITGEYKLSFKFLWNRKYAHEETIPSNPRLSGSPGQRILNWRRMNTHRYVHALHKMANELIRRQLGVSVAAAHNL